MERGRAENFPLFSRVSVTHRARVTRNILPVSDPQLTVIPPSRLSNYGLVLKVSTKFCNNISIMEALRKYPFFNKCQNLDDG